jgi:tetratricopeptide (TPR) repeat protein
MERDFGAALVMLDEVLGLFRQLVDLRGEGRISLARAVALFRLGRFADARTTLERAVGMSGQAGDRYFAMMSRYALARSELLMGDTPAAMRDYRATLEESQAIDLRIGVAVGLDNYAEMAKRPSSSSVLRTASALVERERRPTRTMLPSAAVGGRAERRPAVGDVAGGGIVLLPGEASTINIGWADACPRGRHAAGAVRQANFGRRKRARSRVEPAGLG